MEINLFRNKIKTVISKYLLIDKSISQLYKFYLKSLEDIFSEEGIHDYLKITRMTIIFEGFYRSILEFTPLKQKLNKIRLERWKNHFGSPTIAFQTTSSI